MTNKDYKRLTRKWETSLPTELTPCVHIHDRLWKLENAIEDGKLVFLPCKLGDKFWYIRDAYYPYRRFYIEECQVDQFVVDNDGLCVEDRYEQLAHPINTVYFSEEEAKQALEKMKK